MKTTLSFLLLITSLTFASADNAVLVEYLPKTSAVTPANVSSKLSAASNIEKKSAATGFSGSGENAFYLINISEESSLPTSEDAALEGNAFFEFTLTPADGSPVSLNDMLLNVGYNFGSVNRAANIYLIVTIDIGDQKTLKKVKFGEREFYAATGNGSISDLPAPGTVDLQGLNNITQPAVFRIYAYYESTGSEGFPVGETHAIRIGNIAVNAASN